MAMTCYKDVFSQPSVDFLDMVRNAYGNDPWFDMEGNTKGLWFKNGLWYRENKITVPNVGTLRMEGISLHHDTPYAGHTGRDRTLEQLKRYLWWPKMGQDVYDYVSKCDLCQEKQGCKSEASRPSVAFAKSQMDYGQVCLWISSHSCQTERGQTAIIVFVDRMSKMTVLSPARTDMGAKEVAHIFMDKVCSRFGFPKSIVSDRDTRFTSAFFKEVCLHLSIKQNMSTAFHPQTDGQTERMNRVLEEMLRVFGGKALKTWDLHLPECEFAINNAFNASIRNTPFFLNYGRHPKSPSNIAIQRRIKN